LVSVDLSGAPHDYFSAPTGPDGWTGWYVDARKNRGFVIETLPECQIPEWAVTGYILRRNDNDRLEYFPPELIPLPVAACDQKQIAVGLAGIRIPELGYGKNTGVYASDTPVGTVVLSGVPFDLYEARLGSTRELIAQSGILTLHNGRLFGHEADLRGLITPGTEVTIRERGNESQWVIPGEFTTANYGDVLPYNNEYPDIVTCNPQWTGVEIYELTR